MIEWKIIPGFERYEASSDGRIRNAETGHELRVCRSTNGYLRVGVRAGPPRKYKRGDPKTVQKDMKVHRLVAMAFIPNPDGHPQINHKDLNKHNNNAANLEWVSHRANQSHCAAAGKYDAVQYAERRRKMTPEKVLQMRTEYAAGDVSITDCAKKYGLNNHTVGRILYGKNWPTVGGILPVGARKATGKLTPLQTQLLTVLGVVPLTGADICRALSRPDDHIVYVTLQKMHAAGQIARIKTSSRVFYSLLASQQCGTSNVRSEEGKDG